MNKNNNKFNIKILFTIMFVICGIIIIIQGFNDNKKRNWIETDAKIIPLTSYKSYYSCQGGERLCSRIKYLYTYNYYDKNGNLHQSEKEYNVTTSDYTPNVKYPDKIRYNPNNYDESTPYYNNPNKDILMLLILSIVPIILIWLIPYLVKKCKSKKKSKKVNNQNI